MKIYQNQEIVAFIAKFESRRTEVASDVEATVADILANVRDRGDEALFEYAKKFDKVELGTENVIVTDKELKISHGLLGMELLETVRKSRNNIKSFHEKGKPQSWLTWEEDGVVLGNRMTPMERVGVYVPGGRAAYPSSLLMGVIPAQVAGVKEIIIITPSDSEGNVNPVILGAANELGIKQVFKVGGAHGIAALAYGTETIPRVDKIVGPGNIFVATAKKMLYGHCGIDMVAGPSEVIIIADESANPVYAAADLLAQAEHDPLASAILLTDSDELAQAVQKEVISQTKESPRAEIIESANKNYGGIVLCDTLEACVNLSNQLAPEHLSIHTKDPWSTMNDITNAGAIFLGHFSPEAVGDYWAGPNHVLPTNGSARFFSPLQTDDFMKASSIISYTEKAMKKNGDDIIKFAESEGLQAHANSIRKRMES